MTTKTTYKLYIAYQRGQWKSLRREFDNEKEAFDAIEKIAANHQHTTKLAIGSLTVTEDTVMVIRGRNTFLKPAPIIHCKTCNKRKYRKNINPKTGVCLVCEMREAVEIEQPILI